MRLMLTMLILGFGISSLAVIQPIEAVRVQLSEPMLDAQPILLETKTYGRVYIISKASAQEKNYIEIQALGEQGQELGTQVIRKPDGIRDSISLLRAELNSRNEIVVLQTTIHNGIPGGIYSENLTLGHETQLSSATGMFSYMDRISVAGKNLILVSGYIDPGPNTTPTIYRLVDEDSGELIQQKVLDFYGSGKLGLNSKGELKLLIYGYHIFSLLDIKTAKLQNLGIGGMDAESVPQEVDLAIGHFLTYQNKSGMNLLKLQDLMDGQVKPVKTLPKFALFAGPAPEKYYLSTTPEGIVISDLKAEKSVGPAIPQNTGHNGRENSHIDSLFEAHGELYAVVSDAVTPDSYMPGTRLRYFAVQSGAVLRTSQSDQQVLTGQLFLDKQQRLMSLEVVNLYYHNQTGLTVVDLKTNTTVSTADKGTAIGPSFRSASGEMIQLIGYEDKSLCLINILDASDRSCFQDSMLNPAVSYGYQPFSIKDQHLTLPLLGVENVNAHYPELGYVVIDVR